MKLNKSDLKLIVKQCLMEIMVEDSSVMKAAVGEVLSEMTRRPSSSSSPASRQQAAAQAQRRPQQPQRQQEQLTRRNALLQHTRQTQKLPQQGKRDMWDIIAEDTMKTTLREQLASDRKNEMSNWSALINSQENLDDSPMKHLRAAHATSRDVDQRQSYSTSGEFDATPDVDNMPSPSQLAREFAARGGQQQAPRVNTGVPDDLAALGLGDKRWDVDEPPRRQQATSYDSELARIAAEMNMGQ